MDKKVLVVDSDADLRSAIGALLREAGFDVCFAADGISAMSLATREKPDAIILDAGLPAGDGHSILDRLRLHPHLSTTPIVALSVKDPEELREQFYEQGGVVFLHKPTTDDGLLDALHEAFERMKKESAGRFR